MKQLQENLIRKICFSKYNKEPSCTYDMGKYINFFFDNIQNNNTSFISQTNCSVSPWGICLSIFRQGFYTHP